MDPVVKQAATAMLCLSLTDNSNNLLCGYFIPRFWCSTQSLEYDTWKFGLDKNSKLPEEENIQPVRMQA